MPRYDLPEWVKIYKEKGKTVKIKNGKYYLYSQKNIYDKTKKHKCRKTEQYLGRITEDDGFIPVKIRSSIPKVENSITKHIGAYVLFNLVGENILHRLEEYFQEDGKTIFTIACIRAEERTMYSEIEDAYDENYFSVKYPNLAVSKSSLSNFLEKLSKYSMNMTSFMNEDIEQEDILIFDGTNILCGSQNISYSGYGYNHGHNYGKQVNELYAYSYTKRKAVYYKLLEGSVPDKTSLKDVLKGANIKNCISLIDNGFESNDNINSLLENKNRYIIALKRSSSLVSEEILNDISGKNANEIFINNHETIFAYEINNDNEKICVYFNQTIKGVEMSEYIDKMNANVKGYTKEDFENKQKRFGIYVLKTNVLEKNLQSIYEYYKSRFEIEYMFDTVKNTLNFDKSFMKSDNSLEGWAFINHISILLTQEVYDYMVKKEVNLSLHGLYKKLKHVKVQRNILDSTQTFELEYIPKKTRDLLSKLDINIQEFML